MTSLLTGLKQVVFPKIFRYYFLVHPLKEVTQYAGSPKLRNDDKIIYSFDRIIYKM